MEVVEDNAQGRRGGERRDDRAPYASGTILHGIGKSRQGRAMSDQWVVVVGGINTDYLVKGERLPGLRGILEGCPSEW